jgi:hypothetical protein
MYIPVRAVNPDSLNPDPDTDLDPAFRVNPDPIQIQGFDDQRLKNKMQLKKTTFLLLFLIKNCNLLIPKPP